LLDVVEGFLVGDVVDDDDAVGAAIVRGCDGAEALLARRVPDLQLYRFPVQFNGANFEVDADGGDVRLRVSVVGEPEQQTGFAHPRVSDQQQFEKIIVFGIHGYEGGGGRDKICVFCVEIKNLGLLFDTWCFLFLSRLSGLRKGKEKNDRAFKKCESFPFFLLLSINEECVESFCLYIRLSG